MKITALSLSAVLLLPFALAASATTLYVDITNPSPVAPYTNWVTATTNIQDAVDAAVAADQVLVTNGVYQTGARAVSGMSNRVAVTKPVIVRSVNGPEVTSIVGYQVPGTANGDAAVRCVYLTNGAALLGFTLTNGATQGSGDASLQRSGGGVWCASTAALVSNCVFVANLASLYGGGAYGCELDDCTLNGNSTVEGYGGGGGACSATLNSCTLSNNSAVYEGGGAYGGKLNNCKLSGNSVGYYGGGASSATLNNCVLTGNSATMYGGGVDGGTLNNCTLTGNKAGLNGGGAIGCKLNNCILYYNLAPDGNIYSCTLNFCCTPPLSGGTSTLTAEPQMASTSHLSATSPCRGAGSAAYAHGTDIDGEIWANPPSIGCDEYQSGSVTGALSTAIILSCSNVSVGFGVDLQAVVDGRVSASSWDFGDGVVLSNRPWASHAWSASGDYLVVLRAYNETYPTGVAASAMVQVVTQPVHYVALGSAAPAPPYSSWETAATNIQDALDAVTETGAVVLVSNGVYQAGARVVYGRTTNRVAVTKPVVLRSLNGPGATSIDGSGEYRCVYLTNQAMLSGFTLTNGLAWGFADPVKEGFGGGVLCESVSAVLSNCVLAGNTAYERGGGVCFGTLVNCALSGNWAGHGGGAESCTLSNCTLTGNGTWNSGAGVGNCTLNNCTLSGNSATDSPGAEGGGASYSTLNNCVLTGNSAVWAAAAVYGTLNNCTLISNSPSLIGGSAVSLATLNNCIIYYNGTSAPDNYDQSYGTFLNYCCTTPLPASGIGNFTNAPLFVDLPGADLHLRADSPCINAGLNAYAPAPTDLDGNPRIDGGTVDIGAYEFQGLAAFIAWLGSYGLPTDGSADYEDSDNDLMNNYQEWLAGTDPTNAASVLRLQPPAINPAGLRLSWSSDTNHTYFVQRAASLKPPLAFSLLRGNIPGQPGITAYTDASASAPKVAAFYRIGTGATNGAAPALLQRPAFVPASVTLTWSSVANRTYFIQRATNLIPPLAFSLLQTNLPGLPNATTFTDTNPPSSGPAFYRVGVQP